jgi:hypothetical protein
MWFIISAGTPKFFHCHAHGASGIDETTNFVMLAVLHWALAAEIVVSLIVLDSRRVGQC